MATAGWTELLEVVESIFGATGRQALDQAARHHLCGLRLSIPTRPPLPTAEEIAAAAPGRPAVAAARLGIDRSTAYRKLARLRRMIR